MKIFMIILFAVLLCSCSQHKERMQNIKIEKNEWDIKDTELEIIELNKKCNRLELRIEELEKETKK